MQPASQSDFAELTFAPRLPRFAISKCGIQLEEAMLGVVFGVARNSQDPF
jgi:hypothetical protein